MYLCNLAILALLLGTCCLYVLLYYMCDLVQMYNSFSLPDSTYIDTDILRCYKMSRNSKLEDMVELNTIN